MSKLVAFTVPVLEGKTKEWENFISELNGKRAQEYVRARQKFGVRERVYLQQTPQGNIPVIVLTGRDPEGFLHDLQTANDEFSRWFKDRVKSVHGFDLTSEQFKAPELVSDTDSLSSPAGGPGAASRSAGHEL